MIDLYHTPYRIYSEQEMESVGFNPVTRFTAPDDELEEFNLDNTQHMDKEDKQYVYSLCPELAERYPELQEAINDLWN